VLLAVLVVCLVLFVVLPAVGGALATLVSTLVFGLVLGLVARAVAPGPHRIGLGLTSLVGVAGALAGVALAQVLHTGTFGRLLVQLGCAVLILLLVRASSRRGSLR